MSVDSFQHRSLRGNSVVEFRQILALSKTSKLDLNEGIGIGPERRS
jgi:hypothetical protein